MYSIPSASKELLPWHILPWQELQDRKKQNRLPHALLFTGIAGIGKQLFARQLAESLLCIKPQDTGLACGKCYACQWIKAGTHPDWYEIIPEDEKKPIKIDQIRNVVDFNHKTARFSRFKVIIIYQSHALNINAANALLKTLEEPTPNTVIILVTEHLMLLPETIRSRCQIMYFSKPSLDIAVSWLKSNFGQGQDFEMLLSIVEGAPLTVINFLEKDEFAFRKTIFDELMMFVRGKSELIALAEKWGKNDINRILEYWKSWVVDIIRLKCSDEEKYIKNQDVVNDLREITLRIDLYQLYGFLDEINRLHNAFKRLSNLNSQLLIEGLLIKWLEIYNEVG